MRQRLTDATVDLEAIRLVHGKDAAIAALSWARQRAEQTHQSLYDALHEARYILNRGEDLP